ncbi:DNA repair ATPase [Lacrimispora amygdalina]|uniref:DNA repair ATPase n=1 Tax=Lacrimispora amygdalina TaxID=253257 RepID=A0ABQ5M9B6_9FIRM
MNISRGSEWRQWDLHVHTASSYDYKYKGIDSDELLVKSWRDNGIEAVAITDHFKIDSNRIKRLRELAGNDIIIFPGVEFRTDKGSTNLHVISIFPESVDLALLDSSFEAIMINDKAVAKESNDTIYWDYRDIVEFTQKRNGVLSIHTGDKANGLDKEINNKTLFKMAIKTEYANTVSIYEVSNLSNIEEHKAKVFPQIGVKPIIICSDNHEPRNYERKEKLWIKADRTFDGLIQVINDPEERVFVGEIPPKEDIANKRKSVYIESVKIKKDKDAKNLDSNWFNVDMPLNNGLTVVIGNKGSGKSAFADVLGHLCESNSMEEASFLHQDRFRKGPQKYADDYSGQITWLDGEKSKELKLSANVNETTVQYAQYLPQKFIERVCTDLERDFQNEINKVIFSYVDTTVKGDAKNLEELISFQSHPYNARIQAIHDEIFELNSNIITLETRLTSQYKTSISDNLKKAQEMLDRHLKTIPEEVKKPESKLSPEDQVKLDECETQIKNLQQLIELNRTELTTINSDIGTLTNSITDIDELVNSIKTLNTNLIELKNKYFNEEIELVIKYDTPKGIIQTRIESLLKRKTDIIEILSDSDEVSKSLNKALKEQLSIKKSIVDTADAAEKAYQKYLEDLKQWESTKAALLGNALSPNTVNYYKAELDKIENEYPTKYLSLRESRLKKVKEILEEKRKIVDIHADVYLPIEKELIELLSGMTEKVDFKAAVVLTDKNIGSSLLNHVNHTYTGIFNRTDKAYVVMNKFLRDTDFSDEDSVIAFISNVMKVVDDDIDRSSGVIKDKARFYELLFNLDYIGVEFNLNYSGRDLIELSPGERGIVLLIFYLALNKGEEPIIIDQPEDNLDNESVFKKLVPCIKAAKKRRQVVIVTHNPNIAIACDAEQVIHCEIDKIRNEITYSSGSIENKIIRQKIIDVLEGTKPAFELRSKKYIF